MSRQNCKLNAIKRAKEIPSILSSLLAESLFAKPNLSPNIMVLRVGLNWVGKVCRMHPTSECFLQIFMCLTLAQLSSINFLPPIRRFLVLCVYPFISWSYKWSNVPGGISRLRSLGSSFYWGSFKSAGMLLFLFFLQGFVFFG